jgi:hypothetical protein
MSFHLPNMTTLRKVLAHLNKHKVKVEDPGNEIGPESWAYGFTILMATGGNFPSKAESRGRAEKTGTFNFPDQLEAYH